jgi:hypothetical protein|tara:strand:- start:1662 stop:2144 length:483 start_codon:yes stop_codon:yes gene_type:complete
MKKTSKKTVTVRKQLKIKLENTLTRRKNARNFRPTNSLMVTWFKNLNKGLFGNKLPTVPLYLVRMTDDWGRCWANWDNRKCRKGTYDQSVIPYEKTDVTFAIELHSKYPTFRDFIETLAHEMVHLYQMTILKDPYSNHNANFYAFRNKFKSAGLNLSRTG